MRLTNLVSKDLTHRSDRLDPVTTCPCVLKMDSWSIEKVPEKAERQLRSALTWPPQEVDSKPISALLNATADRHITLLAVVVYMGLYRYI